MIEFKIKLMNCANTFVQSVFNNTLIVMINSLNPLNAQ